jgi:HlyD family secretion protein
MQNIFQKLKDNKNKAFMALAVLVIITVFISNYKSGDDIKLDRFVIKNGVITEVVEVSGQVEADDDIKLSFEKSGIVSLINYKVGDQINKGALIASLSSGDSLGRVRESESILMAQQAELDRIKSGATQAETDIKSQNLENAKLELKNIENQVTDTIKSADISIRNILNYNLSSVFNKTGSGYYVTFPTCDQILQNTIESKRKDYDNLVNTDLGLVKTSADKLSAFVGEVNNLINLPCSSSDATLDSKRSQASAAKVASAAVVNEISAKQSALQSALNAVKRAEKDLALINEGADKNRLAYQSAQVSAAAARLIQARAEFAKNSIISPISGVVASVDVEIGENVSLGKQAVRILSATTLEIKASISENDIAKISLGNKATVTLDAYPDESFEATINTVEPAATNISGVPRYAVTLLMTDNKGKIKPGMTANAFIATKSISDALVLPVSYIKIKGQGGTVTRQINNKETVDVAVKTGIRDAVGNIQIISGLSEGDIIIKNK